MLSIHYTEFLQVTLSFKTTARQPRKLR
jgi:hypothetical protein